MCVSPSPGHAGAWMARDGPFAWHVLFTSVFWSCWETQGKHTTWYAPEVISKEPWKFMWYKWVRNQPWHNLCNICMHIMHIDYYAIRQYAINEMQQHLFRSVCIFVQQHVYVLSQCMIRCQSNMWQFRFGNWMEMETILSKKGPPSHWCLLKSNSFRPFESKALSTLVPATGQEHVSCGSRPFIPMDDAIFHLAKTRGWIPGEVLATPEWLGFTIGF